MKLLTYLLFVFSIFSFSQERLQFTQYMYNMNLINPAYTTVSPSVINMGASFRNQWYNSKGSPTHYSLFSHLTVLENLESGFSVTSEDIGDGLIKENNFLLDVAHIFRASNAYYISLGIKIGFRTYDTNGFQNLEIENRPDPVFADDINSKTFNLGSGVFIHNSKSYLGISVPNFLVPEYTHQGATAVNSLNVFIVGGYVFNLSQDIQFKPSFLTRILKDDTQFVDISSNFRYLEKYEMGISYRLNESISALLNIEVLPNLRLGYSYDYTLLKFGSFNSGSHEIQLLYSLFILGSGFDKSPRFF